MKSTVKGKRANPLILILILIVFFIQAGPAISYGGNGSPGDGVQSPPPTNSEKVVISFDFLLLSSVQNLLI